MLSGCEVEPQKSPSFTETPPLETPAPADTVTALFPAETVIVTAGEASYFDGDLYEAVGTGIKRPDDFDEKCTTVYSAYLFGSGSWDYKDMTKSIKDEGVRKAVDDWIYTAREELRDEVPEFDAFCEARGYIYYRTNESGWTNRYSPPPECTVEAKNGYLSVELTLSYFDRENGLDGIYDCRCAVFDLYSGKKLELSDLFFEGENFLDDLNAEISRQILTPQFNNSYDLETMEFMNYPIKREFTGLTNDCISFTGKNIIFPRKNPFIDGSLYVSINNIYSSSVNYPRDMAGFFDDSVDVHRYTDNHTSFIPGRAIGNVLATGLLRDSFLFSKEEIEKINSAALSMLTDKNVIRIGRERFGWDIKGNDADYYDCFELSIMVMPEERLVEISIMPANIGAFDGAVCRYLSFDTLEPLAPDELMEYLYGADWEESYFLDRTRYAFPEAPEISAFKWFDVMVRLNSEGFAVSFYPPEGMEIDGYSHHSGAAWQTKEKYKSNN